MAETEVGLAPAPAFAPKLLLGLFAAFYEEVASLKRAATRGTLADYLAEGDQAPQAPDAQARAASARLEQVVRAQQLRLRQHASEAQVRMHAAACYVMAALADDVFIFEQKWPGQQAWLGCLLEHRLFGSRLAGRRFFERAEEVLGSHARDELRRDLASCFLLALQLGFKGIHRGPQGAAALDALRQRLWRFVNGSAVPEYAPVLFPEAYEHTVVSRRDERLAPIKPWLRWAGWWLLGFLLLTSMLWLVLVQPLAGPGAGTG